MTAISTLFTSIAAICFASPSLMIAIKRRRRCHRARRFYFFGPVKPAQKENLDSV